MQYAYINLKNQVQMCTISVINNAIHVATMFRPACKHVNNFWTAATVASLSVSVSLIALGTIQPLTLSPIYGITGNVVVTIVLNCALLTVPIYGALSSWFGDQG